MINTQKLKQDINRRLAIFYHPLFLEILEIWFKVLGQQPKQVKVGFILFIELNLRLQKSLLIEFDLKNAFMSALNDWVKEIQDCYELKALFNEEPLDLEQELSDLPFESTLRQSDYDEFLDQFQDHAAYKYLRVKINQEIVSKFFFDLCTTWCTQLDIELFCWFLLSLYFQLTYGTTLQDSKIQKLELTNTFSNEFFEELQNQKALYQRYKKKNLNYYRAWCEWNYLRMEEIGESIIFKTVDFFPEDDRVDDLVGLVIKAIDLVNKEVTQQANQQPPSIQEQNTILDNDDSTNQQEKDNSGFIIEEGKSYVKVGVSYIQKVDPMPSDLFVLRYNEHEQIYVLERKIRIPVIGTAKDITKMTGIEKLQQLKQFQKRNKVQKIPYLNEPTQQIINKPSKRIVDINTGNKVQQPIRVISVNSNATKRDQQIQTEQGSEAILKPNIRRTERERGINKSFSHYVEQPPRSIFLPEFATEQTSILRNRQPKQPFQRIQDQYGEDIQVRKRNLGNDIPLSVLRPNAKPPIAEIFAQQSIVVSQLHNTKLSLKQVEQIEECKHLWDKMMTQEEMELLRQDEDKFYHIMQLLKLKFNQENKSEYLSQLRLKLDYASRRDEMGGCLTPADRQRFQERITGILQRKRRRRRRRKVDRSNSWQVRTKFKNREQREQYKNMFIAPLLEQ